MSVEVGASWGLAVGRGVEGRGESGDWRGEWNTKVLASESPSSTSEVAGVGKRRPGEVKRRLARSGVVGAEAPWAPQWSEGLA